MKEKPFHRPILVTYDEAAILLSVSLRTVQRMVADGRLVAVHPTLDAPRLRYDDLVRAYGGEAR